MIPLLVLVRVQNGKHKFSLWLPLFLIWLLALPFFILALPFLFIFSLFVPFSLGQWLLRVWELVAAFRGLIVDVKSLNRELSFIVK